MSDGWAGRNQRLGIAAIRIQTLAIPALFWNWQATIPGILRPLTLGSPAIRSDGKIVIGDLTGRLANQRNYAIGWSQGGLLCKGQGGGSPTTQ